MASNATIAAELAAKHIDLAIRTLVDVLEHGGPDGGDRVEAARLLIEVASRCPEAFMKAREASGDPPLDQLSAARERRRLLQKLDAREEK